MPEKQLNVWIPDELREYIAQRAKQEDRGMNAIIADLIRQDIARHNGELIEQQSLPVIREIVREEIQKSSAELRRALRLDREFERTADRDFFQKNFNRIAGLTVRSLQNAGIARRLVYSLLAKAFTPTFALQAYEDAKEKMQQELLPRRSKDEDEHTS